ncbi:MAG: SNF2-related protein [Capsulimonadaceae bacterium]|nr:SNF2-related protein [Capsulimonadaceae bacterium]
MARRNILVADYFVESKIKKLVDVREFRRGQALYFRSELEGVEQDHRHVQLTVYDVPHPFDVTFIAEDGEAIPTCSCEVGKGIPGNWCRHAVAGALAMYNWLFRNPPVTWEMRIDKLVDQRAQRAKTSKVDQILIFVLGHLYSGWYPAVNLASTKGLSADIVDAIAAGQFPADFLPAPASLRQVRSSFDQSRLINASPDLVAAAGASLVFTKGQLYGKDRASLFGQILPALRNAPVFVSDPARNTLRPVRISDQIAVPGLVVGETDGDLTMMPEIVVEGKAIRADNGHIAMMIESPLWMMIGDVVTRVDTSRMDVEDIFDTAGITIPSDERNDFIANYLAPLAERVPLSGDSLHWEILETAATPRLYLSQNEDAVQLELRFAYGEYELTYTPNATGRGVRRKAGTNELVQIVRQPEREAEAYAGLLEQGLRRGQKPGELALRARTNVIEFLMHGIPALAAAGYEVYGEELIKSARVNRSRPHISLNVGSGIDWFDVKLSVDFDGVKASLKEIRNAIRHKVKYVKLTDGTYGQLPEDWLEQYRRLFVLGEVGEESVKLRTTQALLLDELLAADDPARYDEAISGALSRLRSFDHVEPVDVPEGLCADLRPYQKAGYDWLHFLRQYGFGGCLADDMGLGKTVQALAFLLWLKHHPADAEEAKRPALVVVPRSLVVNWQREANRFAPELKVLINADSTRVRDIRKLAGNDVVLTTYGTMLRDIGHLSKVRFRYAILDEAQVIKNPAALISKAARMIKADHRLTLTGTPIENSTLDLWSQFDFLNPGLLGTLEQFKSEYAGSIERAQDPAAAAALRKLVFPFILRRTKDQVAPELPPRTERLIVADMDTEQREMYDKYRNHYRAQLLGLIDEGGMNKARMKVLEGLLRLRQIANHPKLVEHDTTVGSVKLEGLIETLSTLQEEGHKVLVFSQFVQMLRLIKAELDAAGLAYEYLTGQTKDRQSVVDRFQTDASVPFLLISLRAGGVGLNLTAADYVMHVDPWWNPAVEMQASDRTHRIGQDKPVFVYKFIVRDTVEDKVLLLQDRKRQLVTQVIASDTGFFKSLTRDDVNVLFD